MSSRAGPADRHVFLRIAGDAYTLRVTLRHDEAGRPTWLALCRGFGEGEAWRPSFGEVCTVEARLLPELRAALAQLDG